MADALEQTRAALERVQNFDTATSLRDFDAVEREARAAMQSAADQAAALTKELAAQKQEADKIVGDIRKVAAEQGLSQQAMYFQNESLEHEKEADSWRAATIWIAIGLAIYSALSVFLDKWTGLQTADAYSALQVAMSKVLVFAVMAYMLIVSARNFLSHKHNEIVNRHRQNALLTFNTLVSAAGNDEARDIVLTYAAACIFAPQETGFAKAGGNVAGEVPTNVIQAVPRLVPGAPAHSSQQASLAQS